MNYQSLFLSSQREEERKRDLIQGSRSFRYRGEIYYYAYTAKIVSLKERILSAIHQINRLLLNLDEAARKEILRSNIMEEVVSSLEIDGYPYSRKLEKYYFEDCPPPIKMREKPLKNLSLRVGFTVAPPCQKKDEIKEAKDQLEQWIEENAYEDILVTNLVYHFAFETLHPFQSWNGILGRAYLSKRLSHTIYEYIAYRISAYFKADVRRYFLSFKDAQNSKNHCNIGIFIEKMMEIIVEGVERDALELKEKVRRYKGQVALIEKLDLKDGEKETMQGILMMRVFSYRKISLSRLAALLGKSERTIFRHQASIEKKCKFGEEGKSPAD